MARLFFDSFDAYDSAHRLYKWSGDNTPGNGSSIDIVSGIAGMTANCLRLTTGNVAGYTWRNLPSVTTIFTGSRHSFPLPPTAQYIILGLHNSGNQQILVGVDSAGSIKAWVGAGASSVPQLGALLCQSATAVVSSNISFHLGVSAVISNSATGSVSLYVNNVLVASASSVVTSGDGVSACNQIAAWAGLSGFTFYVDDVIVNDSTGSENNSRVVEQRVDLLIPVGNGLANAWTKTGAATNWQAATSTTPNPDDDTSYVAAATTSLVDSYTVTTPANIGTPTAVQWVAACRTDDGGSAQVTPVIGDGVTTANGTAIPVPSSYQYLLEVFDKNPITGLAWTAADMLTIQPGINRTA